MHILNIASALPGSRGVVAGTSSGLGVLGLMHIGFRVWGSGFEALGFRIQGSGFEALGFRVQALRLEV